MDIKFNKEELNKHDWQVANATLQSVEDILDRKVEEQLNRDLPTDVGAWLGAKLNQQVKVDTYRELKKELAQVRKMI